jgi:hypothetical protein
VIVAHIIWIFATLLRKLSDRSVSIELIGTSSSRAMKQIALWSSYREREGKREWGREEEREVVRDSEDKNHLDLKRDLFTYNITLVCTITINRVFFFMHDRREIWYQQSFSSQETTVNKPISSTPSDQVSPVLPLPSWRWEMPHSHSHYWGPAGPLRSHRVCPHSGRWGCSCFRAVCVEGGWGVKE